MTTTATSRIRMGPEKAIYMATIAATLKVTTVSSIPAMGTGGVWREESISRQYLAKIWPIVPEDLIQQQEFQVLVIIVFLTVQSLHYFVATLLLCCCYAVAMLLLYCCYAVARLLLCCCYVVAMLLLCCCCAVVMPLLCCCYAVGMLLLCYCYAVLMLSLLCLLLCC